VTKPGPSQLANSEERVTRRRIINNDRYLWIGRARPEDLPWTHKNAVKFASGREALVALLGGIGLGPGDIVLLPAFVPEGVIAPCRVKGLDIHFYSLDRNLDPDWSHLEELATALQPRLAVLIHYFGIRREAGRFVAICHRNGALVVEDLAHAQKLPESSLGADGDFVLHSLTKIVGVADGAVLEMAAAHLLPLKPRPYCDPRRAICIVMNMARLLVTSASRRFGSPAFWSRFWNIFGRFFYSYPILMWYFKRPTPMSGLSKALLARFPWRDAVVKRLRHERRYRADLDGTVFGHLGGVAETGHCTMGYAVVVEQREALFDTLAAQGIYGIWFEYKWDHFPADVVHDDARWVMKHHFLFPTAYALSDEEVKEVIRVANEWAIKQKAGHVAFVTRFHRKPARTARSESMNTGRDRM